MLSRFHTPKPTANRTAPVVKKLAILAFFMGGMRFAALVYFRMYVMRTAVAITIDAKTT